MECRGLGDDLQRACSGSTSGGEEGQACLLLGCRRSAILSDVNAHDQQGLIGRFYDDMWNQFDMAVFADVLDPDIKFRGSLGQEKVGYAEFGDYVDFVQRFSPDFHNTVLTTITEDNRTFARLSYTGTHQGEVFGVQPTRRAFEYAGAAVFSFNEHRISEVWVLGDIYGLLQQLR